MLGILNEGAAGPDPEHVRRALAIADFDTLAAWRKMAPERRSFHPVAHHTPPKPAAVLLLLFPRMNEWRVVLTRRAEQLSGHGGQISFPGGKIEATDPDARCAALRETREELGINTDSLELLGELSPVHIAATHFRVQVFVGMLKCEPLWRPDAREVAAVFSMSLSELLEPATKKRAHRWVRGRWLKVPFYAVQGHEIWGATAMMLSELEWRLRQSLPLA